MFENCNSLADLNAMRTKAVQNGADIIEVNNAYNERRKEILASRVNFFRLKELIITPETSQTYAGLPIIGSSKMPGTIEITMGGILV